MRKLSLSSLFLILIAVGRSQTISDFLSVPFPTDLHSSRDGKKIAWVFNERGIRNIFIAEAPAFTAKAITNFTSDDGMDINNLQFSPDGKRLLFIRGNAPNSRGEMANPAQLQTPTGRTVWIAEYDSLRKIGNGVSPGFSPDGKTVAYINQGDIWTLETDSSKAGERLFSIRGGAEFHPLVSGQ